MTKSYILAIDQSTQGTKALLFDRDGTLICRADRPHKQIISEEGWVSHDLDEIYGNVIQVVKDVVEKAGIDKEEIAGLGISNQRETVAAWDKNTGKPIADAIVWQCSRAEEICKNIEKSGKAEIIRQRTGIQLSPYFPAAKLAWYLQNVDAARGLEKEGNLLLGTIDTWLLYKLTHGKAYKTEYSNASRTQLFNLRTLTWDEEICNIFGINPENLAEVCDSNSEFGKTDFDGYLQEEIPVCGVLGDSHGALFGQGCIEKGMVKATYGTGSSVMMNVGEAPAFSEHGIVTSLAWGMDGKIQYVLEGNINYTGAVISWLKNEMELIASAKETEQWALEANPADNTYLVPAFTGLGAPYWASGAKAIINGMSRTTGKKELVKAALDCIAYQIMDIVELMKKDSGIKLQELRVDGGATGNNYLMQFQSDMIQMPVQVPDAEELSGIGVAYVAGRKLRLYNESIFKKLNRKQFVPIMKKEETERKKQGWLESVKLSMGKS